MNEFLVFNNIYNKTVWRVKNYHKNLKAKIYLDSKFKLVGLNKNNYNANIKLTLLWDLGALEQKLKFIYSRNHPTRPLRYNAGVKIK